MGSELTLSVPAQQALRELMSTEPLEAGLRDARRILLALSHLIPCDVVGVGLSDRYGSILHETTLPRNDYFDGAPMCPHPLALGVHVWSREPEHVWMLQAIGLADGMGVGFRRGRGEVVQVYFDRERTPFAASDLRLLHVVTPALDRIFRRPAPPLPSTVTPAERRVLQLVAAGLSNAEIARSLGVAPSTVRKHLEHAYRKLGVSSRLAAVVRLEGACPDDPDLRGQIGRLG